VGYIAAQWRAAAAVGGGRGGGGGCVGGGMPRGSSIDWAPLFTPTTALSRHRRFITVRVFVWVPLFAPSAHRPYTYLYNISTCPPLHRRHRTRHRAQGLSCTF